ncbi:MAG TPA: DUF3352 domain-containing protein [Pyrinomonadaceae bacterium]|nr:DUF3352 domain-containing protein [Pyrinomonadaceae bacterium]
MQPPEPQSQLADRPIEELLSSESYAAFAEVRNLGQLSQRGEVKMALDSLRLMGETPSELDNLVRFLNVNAEVLNESRLVLSFLPVRAELPRVLVALKLASPESAKTFEPKLRAFVAGQLQPDTAAATDATGPAPETRVRRGGRRRSDAGRRAASPSFALKRAGSWLLGADESFTLKRLRGDGTSMLADNARFQTIKGRFTSEPLFVYLDTTLAERSTQAMAEKNERDARKAEESMLSSQTEATMTVRNMNTAPPQDEVTVIAPTALPSPGSSPEIPVRDDPSAELILPPSEAPPLVTSGEEPVARTGEDPKDVAPVVVDEAAQHSLALVSLLARGLWGNASTKWPEAIGVAVGFEGDAIAVRALVTNRPQDPLSLIPFAPNIISGPAASPESPSVAPADSEIFVGATLDWARMYAALMETANTPGPPEMVYSEEEGRMVEPLTVERPPSADKTIEAVEKLFNFKIKEDLLPALGGEIAVSLPIGEIGMGPKLNSPKEPEKAGEKDARAGLVVLISLNNPDKIRSILPRVLTAFGLVTPGATAQMEKREGVEIHSYGSFAYAIVNNFLVVAQNAPPIRHVVDGYASQQTLAAAEGFRDSTGWEPRQKLAQIYVSEALMKTWIEEVKKISADSTDPSVILLRTQMEAPPQGPTYAVTNEGEELLHELRLPIGLVKSYAAATMIGIKEMPVTLHEAGTSYALRTIASAQENYRAKKGGGSYGTLEELIAAGLVEKEYIGGKEYKIEVSASGDKFEVTAVPLDYGKTGRRSFFIDQSGVIRGANHKGQPATADDPPID